jgi:hypothetical protein
MYCVSNTEHIAICIEVRDVKRRIYVCTIKEKPHNFEVIVRDLFVTGNMEYSGVRNFPKYSYICNWYVFMLAICFTLAYCLSYSSLEKWRHVLPKRHSIFLRTTRYRRKSKPSYHVCDRLKSLVSSWRVALTLLACTPAPSSGVSCKHCKSSPYSRYFWAFLF